MNKNILFIGANGYMGHGMSSNLLKQNNLYILANRQRNNIESLIKEGAKEIYYEDYWCDNKVPHMPDDLKHIYFDMCVNQGRGRAVKILQRAANAKGAGLKVDGGMGPKTLAAMKGVELDRVRAYRVKYYADLVTRKPDLEKFYFGWFRRALEV